MEINQKPWNYLEKPCKPSKNNEKPWNYLENPWKPSASINQHKVFPDYSQPPCNHTMSIHPATITKSLGLLTNCDARTWSSFTKCDNDQPPLFLKTIISSSPHLSTKGDVNSSVEGARRCRPFWNWSLSLVSNQFSIYHAKRTKSLPDSEKSTIGRQDNRFLSIRNFIAEHWDDHNHLLKIG